MKNNGITAACRNSVSFSAYAQLCKVRISALAGLFTAAGHLLARGGPSLSALVTAAAVFLLSAGAGALNNIQDRRIDGRMDRTRGRVLPSGKLSPVRAGLPAAACLAAGMLILVLLPADTLSLILAGCAVLIYNGIYTPLKRITPWAFLPGAVAGAVPPVIGWLAAGGSAADPVLFQIAAAYLWQIPHTVAIHGRYRTDYERAGIPCLPGRTNHPLSLRSETRDIA